MGLVWRMCPSLGLKDGKEEAINPNSKAPFQAPPLPQEQLFFVSFLNCETPFLFCYCV